MLLGLQWWWWLVGTVGIGGAIAFLVLAPALAAQVFAVVLNFLIGTRIGIGIIVGIAVWFASDTYRSNADAALWQKRVAAFEQAQAERDKKIDADARAAVRKEIEDEKAATAQTEQVTNDWVKTLPPLAATDIICRVGPDADKLRLIAGATVSAGKPAVSKLGSLRAAAGDRIKLRLPAAIGGSSGRLE